jgi:hypothetical protein
VPLWGSKWYVLLLMFTLGVFETDKIAPLLKTIARIPKLTCTSPFLRDFATNYRRVIFRAPHQLVLGKLANILSVSFRIRLFLTAPFEKKLRTQRTLL